MTDRTDESDAALARVRTALERRFGVDPRALAAFRISLAAILLVDLGLRARDLTAFYTDAGVFPRDALFRHYPAVGRVSIHAAFGETLVQAVFILVAIAFAVALIVGYRTRIATVASFALLLSLQMRNPMVLNAGDILFRRLMFWGIFLPLGTRWAIRPSSENTAREWVATVATVALLVQVVLVYFTNVVFKLRRDVWLNGEAIRNVFELDGFTVGLAPVVAQHPALLDVAALGWVALLCVSPLLILSTGSVRTLLVALFTSAHLGMFLTMDLGIFPLVSMAALVPFLPSAVWDRLQASLGPIDDQPAFSPVRSLAATPSPFGRRSARARSVLVTGLLVTMILLNVFALGVIDRPAVIPAEAEDKSWNMFSYPPQSEGWYVANATLDSGREVTGHVSADRWGGATDGTDRYPRGRWRKIQSNVARSDDEQLLTSLAGDVCRRWSASGDEAVRSVRLVYVREASNPRGEDRREATVVKRHDC